MQMVNFVAELSMLMHRHQVNLSLRYYLLHQQPKMESQFDTLERHFHLCRTSR